jgi:hypothetical protein
MDYGQQMKPFFKDISNFWSNWADQLNKIWGIFACTTRPERISNPITAMGFSAMFTFQLDNTKK